MCKIIYDIYIFTNDQNLSFVTYKNFQELEKGLMEIVKQKNNESLKKIEEEEFE